MTLRERLKAVLLGGGADACPWFADLNYWYVAHKEMGTLPPQYAGENGLLRLHQDLNVGIYLYTPPLILIEHDRELFYTTERQVDLVTTEVTIHTPEGSLTQHLRKCQLSCSTAVLEYPVKTVEDLKCVRAWYEASEYIPNYDAVLDCDLSWGEWGMGLPLVPRTPLAALIVEWAGLKNFTEIYCEAPYEVESTIHAMQRAEDHLYELVCNAPYPFVAIPDNLSAEAVEGFWRIFSYSYYAQRIEQLHASGKKVACHIDGTIGNLLSALVEVGVDFPESVVPAPVGDLTPAEIRKAAGERTVLWGGVPGAMFTQPFTREEVLDHVKRVIDEMGSEGKLVLASADQVPPNGDIQLVKDIADFVFQYTCRF